MESAPIVNNWLSNFVLKVMRVLWLFLFIGSVWAKAPEPVQPLNLPKGPVRDVLKKNYKIHLVRNITEEVERELEKKLPKKQ